MAAGADSVYGRESSAGWMKAQERQYYTRVVSINPTGEWVQWEQWNRAAVIGTFRRSRSYQTSTRGNRRYGTIQGPVQNTIHQLVGGIRSSMGYCGCETIKEFGRKTTMVQVTGAALKENHPHEVRIVKEAPNYQVSEG